MLATASGELEDMVITWGKHKSLTFKEAYEKDPAWIGWTLSHLTSPSLQQKVFLHFVSLRVTEEERVMNLEPLNATTAREPAVKAKAMPKTKAKARSSTAEEEHGEEEFEVLNETPNMVMEQRMAQMEGLMAQMIQFMHHLNQQQNLETTACVRPLIHSRESLRRHS